MSRYEELINSISKDRETEIAMYINGVMDEIYTIGGNYEGLCKYAASNIRAGLCDYAIKSYLIDMNDLGVDHVSLIAEYYKDTLKRVLIDPTIWQFKINIASYVKNQDLIRSLRDKGYVFVDDESFSNYLSMFSGKEEHINLTSYLSQIDGKNR